MSTSISTIIVFKKINPKLCQDKSPQYLPYIEIDTTSNIQYKNKRRN